MPNEEDFKTGSFETRYQLLTGGNWTPKAVKQSAEQLAYMCLCGKCQSYTGTGEDQLVFCTIGKSERIQQQKSCLCKQCGVTKTMNMRWAYYCTNGSAFQLSDLPK
jgi:hypothetical protein